MGRQSVTPQTLTELGYRPIALAGKRPKHAGWRDCPLWDAADDGSNIGILTGRVVALDVDIDDVGIAAFVEEAVVSRWGLIPCRVGRAPRRMFIFRTDDATFPKVTRNLSAKGKQCRVEVLGTGQQFAAFGMHPDTGRPYTWPTPLAAISRLPCVSRVQMQEFLDALVAGLEAHGVTLAAPVGTSAVECREPMEVPGLPDGTPSAVREALARASPHGWDQTVAVGMALKAAHEQGEPWAEEAFRAFARTSDRYPINPGGGEWITARWESFNPAHSSIDSLCRATKVDVHSTDFEESPPEPLPAIRTGFVTLADWADRPTPRWLIKEVLPEAGLFAIIAKPNIGKSFLMLDMMDAITHRRDWFGKASRPPDSPLAVLFAYEGSVAVRARALRTRHRNAGERIMIEHGWPSLTDEDSIDQVVERLRAAQSHFGARVCIVAFDTLNLALKGASENDGESMGAALTGLKRIQHALPGAAVGVVHHVGKDVSKGARGHSSLLGGIDTQLTLDEGPGGVRNVILSKSRDSDRSGIFGSFALRTVVVGQDDDGDPITSCVVSPQALVEADRDGENREQVLTILRKAAVEGTRVSETSLRKLLRLRNDAAGELIAQMVQAGTLAAEKIAGRKGREIKLADG